MTNLCQVDIKLCKTDSISLHANPIFKCMIRSLRNKLNYDLNSDFTRVDISGELGLKACSITDWLYSLFLSLSRNGPLVSLDVFLLALSLFFLVLFFFFSLYRLHTPTKSFRPYRNDNVVSFYFSCEWMQCIQVKNSVLSISLTWLNILCITCENKLSPRTHIHSYLQLVIDW